MFMEQQTLTVLSLAMGVGDVGRNPFSSLGCLYLLWNTQTLTLALSASCHQVTVQGLICDPKNLEIQFLLCLHFCWLGVHEWAMTVTGGGPGSPALPVAAVKLQAGLF